MSTNVSKKKREDLLSKIGQIRTFIASRHKTRIQEIFFLIYLS